MLARTSRATGQEAAPGVTEPRDSSCVDEGPGLRPGPCRRTVGARSVGVRHLDCHGPRLSGLRFHSSPTPSCRRRCTPAMASRSRSPLKRPAHPDPAPRDRESGIDAASSSMALLLGGRQLPPGLDTDDRLRSPPRSDDLAPTSTAPGQTRSVQSSPGDPGRARGVAIGALEEEVRVTAREEPGRGRWCGGRAERRLVAVRIQPSPTGVRTGVSDVPRAANAACPAVTGYLPTRAKAWPSPGPKTCRYRRAARGGLPAARWPAAAPSRPSAAGRRPNGSGPAGRRGVAERVRWTPSPPPASASVIARPPRNASRRSAVPRRAAGRRRRPAGGRA